VNVFERRLLQTLLTQPTAPYREHYVRAVIEATARRLDLRTRRDRFGNVYVAYRQGRAAPIAFTAHMDHPGFEVLVGGRRPSARLLGGVKASHLRGARVVFHPDPPDARGRPHTDATPAGIRGRIVAVHSHRPRRARRSVVEIEAACKAHVEPGSFGYFDLPGFELQRDRLASKGLDNLLSCAAILAVMARLRRRRSAADLLGVFTRAEEVGFVGAGGVLRSRALAASRPLVVLETSQASALAPIGAGPVLRVGDRMTSFDPEMDVWLADRAADLARRRKRFRYQRALMTGGACEASLYVLHGRRVGAVALPLGNYHNMTTRGSIGSEHVSPDDFDNLLLLLDHLCARPPEPGIVRTRRAELDAVYTRLSNRLLTGK
jgi:endoglucanase